jgi:trehalose 6-phosphate synthase
MVRPHPISVVFPQAAPENNPPSNESQSRSAILKGLGPETLFLGIGIDRIDYTKGMTERFRGIERFLEKYPQYTQKFTFLQFGAPSRTNIKRYQDFMAEVRSEAQRINERFQSGHWKPIVFYDRHHSHQELEPFNKAADLCLVTSLHDGMNLVAKEFVASRDDEQGVLILSRFTGAARELRDAVLVNPYDIERTADAIRYALELEPEERTARMQRLRKVVKEQNIYRWAANLIGDLCDVRLKVPAEAKAETRVAASPS